MNLLFLGGGVLGEGIVREFGIDVYTLLFLTGSCCLTQETLLNILQQSNWENNLKKNRYMYMYK